VHLRDLIDHTGCTTTARNTSSSAQLPGHRSWAARQGTAVLQAAAGRGGAESTVVCFSRAVAVPTGATAGSGRKLSQSDAVVMVSPTDTAGVLSLQQSKQMNLVSASRRAAPRNARVCGVRLVCWLKRCYML
jgi:hypothetical protein